MIHQANQEVISVIEKTPQQGDGGKRKPYIKISDTLRAKIGKYALENGNAAASRKFSKEFDSPLSESTVRSLKKSYTAALESKKRSITESTDDTALSSLPPKKRRRPLLLLGGMDAQVQAYIRNARDRGCPVTSSVVIAAARGVVKKTNQMLLEDKGGPLSINKSWAKSFLCRMGFVKRKGTTTFKVTPDNFDSLKNAFLEQIKTTVEFENIPLDLVFKWD